MVMLKNLEPFRLPDGSWGCDIGFTKEDWLEVLKNDKCSMQYISTLAIFLRCEDHKSTCTDAAKNSKVSTASSIRNRITHFGQIAQDVINRVEIRRDNDSNIFWLFPMTGQELKSGLFEWKLRDELAEALLQYIKELQMAFIEEYPKESISSLAIQDYTNLEKTSFCYKLEFGLDILGGISGSTAFKFGIYKANNAPKLHDGVKFEDGYAWQERFGDTYENAYIAIRKTVADIALLASKKKFEAIEDIELADTVKWKIAYLYSNRSIIPIFNIDMLSKVAELWGMKNASESSYTELQNFLLGYQNDDEDDLEFSYRLLRKIKSIPDADEDKNDRNELRYYLAGFTFNDGGDQLQRFINDSIWEGSGTKSVNKLIEGINKGDIIILKSTSTKGKKHDQPFLRVYGAMRIVSEKPEKVGAHYRVETEYIPVPQKDFDGNKFGRYRQTVHICEEKDIVEYINQFIKYGTTVKPIMDCSEYISQLKRSHNLILTGAPGTGKTYLAKAIAEQMGAEWAMVQFHPSYDYTDFVEGIRPNKDHGFERVDGAFKSFCKRALKNFEDSKKTVSTLQHEADAEEKLSAFLESAIVNHTEFKIKSGNKFYIQSANDRNIFIEVPGNDKTDRVSLQMRELLGVLKSEQTPKAVKDIQSILGQKYPTQQDSYIFVLCQAIADIKANATKIASTIARDFVFIIDEINRGEISKIFGELFFSIDPGYRGIAGKIDTQYQNLVESDDEFSCGFYVPKNVYIIGTMNDIDRSVESMDFAIRRRFAWREILPEERIKMWDGKIDSFKDEAKERMSSLNHVIADPANGLGPEYCIGPAYFLHLSKDEYNGDFDNLWVYNLKGVLNEYLRGNRDSARIMSYFEKAYNLEYSEDEAGNTDN